MFDISFIDLRSKLNQKAIGMCSRMMQNTETGNKQGFVAKPEKSVKDLFKWICTWIMEFITNKCHQLGTMIVVVVVEVEVLNAEVLSPNLKADIDKLELVQRR